jgi:hypothetical protein
MFALISASENCTLFFYREEGFSLKRFNRDNFGNFAVSLSVFRKVSDVVMQPGNWAI